jgi:hypothetical protein
MNNPFRKSMPLSTDLKIRCRIFGEWLRRHKVGFSAMVAVPVVAAFVLFVMTPVTIGPNTAGLVAEVRAAQKVTETQAREQVYYVLREVREGSGKAAYVEAVTGERMETPQRVDRVESYQHNETAITRINSNTSARPFEVYLSRQHDAGLAMHHYGPIESTVSAERAEYDAVHDLTSLYEAYVTLATPTVPVLPEAAQFIEFDAQHNTLTFVDRRANATEVEYVVAVDTGQLLRETTFLNLDGTRYEMTTTTYLETTALPAATFATVFAPEQYDFTLIASQ